MQRSTRKESRRAGFEHLEPRALLAGDVTVEVVGGNLRIHGDELDNHLIVAAGAEEGQYVITGLPDADGVDTTVNTEASVIVEGVRGNVRAFLRQGNDGVTFQRMSLPGTMRVNTGRGDDLIALDHVRVGGGAFIQLGTGSNTANVDTATVGGSLRIGAWSGPYEVPVGTSAVPGDNRVSLNTVDVGRLLSVRTDRGNDQVELTDTSAGSTVIHTRHGDDTVNTNGGNAGSQLFVFTGKGNDRIGILGTRTGYPDSTDAVGGRVQLNVGHGRDSIVVRDAVWTGHTSITTGPRELDIVRMENVTIGGGLGIRGSRGADEISLTGVEVRGPTKISTGGSDDTLNIVDSVFGGRFVLNMGRGNDLAEISGSTFEGAAILLSGSGEDTLVDDDNEFLGLFYENFEL